VVLAPSRLHALAARFLGLSPYEVPELGVLRHGRRGRTPGGVLGAERGSHPPRYTPSYRAPRVMFSPVAGPPDLPWPPVASPQPQHRRAPHTSQRYVFPPCRGGDLHPLSHAQPSGFGPEDPFRVAQPTPGSPQVCGLRSSRGLCPQRAAFGAAPARISPSTRLTRQRGEVAGPPDPHVRPRRQPGSRSQAV
jgi:hypothetical protein